MEYITKNRPRNVCPVQGASIKHVMSPNYDEKRAVKVWMYHDCNMNSKNRSPKFNKKKMNTLAFDHENALTPWAQMYARAYIAFFGRNVTPKVGFGRSYRCMQKNVCPGIHIFSRKNTPKMVSKTSNVCPGIRFVLSSKNCRHVLIYLKTY